MFNDKLSQRILSSFLGVSALFLATSALLFTLNHTNTATAADQPEVWDEGLRGAVGLGIQDSTGYFITWGQPNLFYKVDLSKAQDWYKTSE